MKSYLTVFMMALLVALAGGPGMSWAQQLPPRDPLAPLKHALRDAGAPPLTSEQEQQLISLVTQFRTLKQTQAQTQQEALQAVHRAYENAVLAGDGAGAQAAAEAIATQVASGTRTNLQAEANFRIQVLKVLGTNDNQIGQLLQRMGSQGVFRLLGFFGPGAGRFAKFPGGR